MYFLLCFKFHLWNNWCNLSVIAKPFVRNICRWIFTILQIQTNKQTRKPHLSAEHAEATYINGVPWLSLTARWSNQASCKMHEGLPMKIWNGADNCIKAFPVEWSCDMLESLSTGVELQHKLEVKCRLVYCTWHVTLGCKVVDLISDWMSQKVHCGSPMIQNLVLQHLPTLANLSTI